MKILTIMPIWDSYGASKTGMKIALNAAKAGHHVVLFAPMEYKDERVFLEHERIDVKFLDLPILRKGQIYSWRFPISILKLFSRTFRLRAEIRKHQPDLIHFLTLASVNPLLYFFESFRKTKTHLSVHEIPHNFLEKCIFSIMMKSFDIVSANSRYVSSSFFHPIDIVIFPSIDLDPNITVRDSASIFPKGKRTRIACVGRFNEWKGQGLVYSAFAQSKVLNEYSEIFFIGGPLKGEEKYFENLVELVTEGGHKHLVHFMGQIENVRENLETMDILLVPSTRPEPFGKVVLEGFQASCLVIASNAGGPIEIIDDGKNGLLHESGNLNSLIEKVEWAINNPEVSRVIANNGREFLFKLGATNFEDRYLQLWNKLSMRKDSQTKAHKL